MAIVNDQKQKYTLLSGTHMTGGVVYDASDNNRNVMQLTKRQAENLGDRVRLEGAQGEVAAGKEEDKVNDPNPNLSGGSAAPVNEKTNDNNTTTVNATNANTTNTNTTNANTTNTNTTNANTTTTASTNDESNAKFTSLLSGNLSDVESEIGKINNNSDLDTLAKLEQSGKQRSGVMKMIRERKEELK